MYISIHLNSTNSPSWRGLQIFYTNKNKENKLIAETVTEYLKENVNNIRDIKPTIIKYYYAIKKRIRRKGK